MKVLREELLRQMISFDLMKMEQLTSFSGLSFADGCCCVCYLFIFLGQVSRAFVKHLFHELLL